MARVERVAGLVGEAYGLRANVRADLDHLTIALHRRFSEGEAPLGDLLELREDRVVVAPGGSYPQIGIQAYGGGLFVKPEVAAEETTYRVFNRLAADMLVLSQVKGWEGAVAVCDATLEGRFASPEYRAFRCHQDCMDPA